MSAENENIRILIVDDSEIARTLICRILEGEGYMVSTAANGVEGYEMAEALKPDIMLLDCEMPQMGGVKMLEKVRDNIEIKDTPVVFLTSVATPRNILDCFKLDAENYLSKPVISHMLLKQIDQTAKKYKLK